MDIILEERMSNLDPENNFRKVVKKARKEPEPERPQQNGHLIYIAIGILFFFTLFAFGVSYARPASTRSISASQTEASSFTHGEGQGRDNSGERRRSEFGGTKQLESNDRDCGPDCRHSDRRQLPYVFIWLIDGAEKENPLE